jgi:hypothetical protein
VQNKYVGDIGDYCKLGLLRWLLGTHSETGQCKFSLGVCWYAVTNTFDPPQNRDGRHIDYLGLKNIGDGQIVEHMDSAQLSHLDPALWHQLRQAVLSGTRQIAVLESILEESNACRFHSGSVPENADWRIRISERNEWLRQAVYSVGNQDLLFLDPDNGLASERMRASSRTVAKHILADELSAFSEASSSGLVFYHHLGQHLPHKRQMELLHERLTNSPFDRRRWEVSSLVFNRYSCRAFILLSRCDNGDGRELKRRFELFADQWKRPEGAVQVLA